VFVAVNLRPGEKKTGKGRNLGGESERRRSRREEEEEGDCKSWGSLLGLWTGLPVRLLGYHL
jgi:hypothetical protein